MIDGPRCNQAFCAPPRRARVGDAVPPRATLETVSTGLVRLARCPLRPRRGLRPEAEERIGEWNELRPAPLRRVHRRRGARGGRRLTAAPAGRLALLGHGPSGQCPRDCPSLRVVHRPARLAYAEMAPRRRGHGGAAMSESGQMDRFAGTVPRHGVSAAAAGAGRRRAEPGASRRAARGARRGGRPRKSAPSPASRPGRPLERVGAHPSRVPLASSVSSASVAGTRPAISATGASSRTSTCHSHGSRASIRTMCAAGSKPGSGGAAGSPIAARPMRSARNVRSSPLARSRAGTYQRPAPRDEAERLDLARARRAVAAHVVDRERSAAAGPPRRPRAASRSTPAAPVGLAERLTSSRRRSTRRASRSGRTRAIFASASPAATRAARRARDRTRPRSPPRRRASAAAGASRRGAGSRRPRPAGRRPGCRSRRARRRSGGPSARSPRARSPPRGRRRPGRLCSSSRKARRREAGREIPD